MLILLSLLFYAKAITGQINLALFQERTFSTTDFCPQPAVMVWLKLKAGGFQRFPGFFYSPSSESMLLQGLRLVALSDIRRRPLEQINGSKRFWGLSLINFFGSLTYFVVRS